MPLLSSRDRFIVWLAQGFGSGRAPFAPGTFGTLVGVGWFALLLWPDNLWFYLAGTIAGVFASVWLCGQAERILGQHDPGSVVIDEIIAMPIALGGWFAAFTFNSTGQHPLAVCFLQQPLIPLAGFALFRLFDIWKPWPVKQSQSLSGGWGVTADDLLAALYVNLVFLPFLV